MNLPLKHEEHEGVGDDAGRSMISSLRSLTPGLWRQIADPRRAISCLRSPVSVVVALLLSVGWALAQPGQSQGPVFKYYVWGQIRNPGAFSLGGTPDLMELLSAAGGPTQYANVRRVVLIRATTQQREIINLKTMMFSGQVISLSPGDIVIVPNSAWYFVREYISVTATLVSFATLVFTVMNWAAAR